MFKSAQQFAARLSRELNDGLGVSDPRITLTRFGPVVAIPPYDSPSPAVPGQGQHTAVILGPFALVHDEFRWHFVLTSQAVDLMTSY